MLISIRDTLSACGAEPRWTARKLLQLEPCWQAGSPWTSTAPQRAFDQSFHKSEKTDFVNTLLFFLLYLVLPFIFFQSFTQRNYWMFYCNRVKGALYFIFILIFEAGLFNIISSPCEFTQQGSPLQLQAGLAVLRRDRSDSPGDRVCTLGLFFCTGYHNILKYFEMRIFILNNRKIKYKWNVFLLLFCCGFPSVPGRGVSFSGGLSVFLPMAVQQLVVILVLWQEKMRTRLSTPPWAFNLVNCISV